MPLASRFWSWARLRPTSSLSLNWATFVQQMVSVWIVIVGVYLIAAGHLTMGGLIACVLLSGRAMAPLSQVAGLLTRLNQSRESLKHLDELMKRPVERPAGKHFITLQHVQGRVEFRDVVFNYPGQSTPAVNHLSFTIEPGERVGIIGAVRRGFMTHRDILAHRTVK